VPGSQAIAQGVEDPEFHSYVIAHESAGIGASEEQLPEAVRGTTFTFGSKGSTSGRLMPEHFLRQRFGEAPEAIFERVGFSGDHSKTIDLVEAGSYQVGAVNFKVWEKEVAAGEVDTDAVQVIWKTPPYPDYNWSIRGDVPEDLRERVAAALIGLEDEELLGALSRSGFIPAENADFQPIEDVAIDVGIIRR